MSDPITWTSALLILASGVFAAVITIIVEFFRSRHLSRKKCKGAWGAIRVEIEDCGKRAEGYISHNVYAPNYRFVTKSYNTCLTLLLSEGAITTEQSDALLEYYIRVEALNRGFERTYQLVLSKPGAVSEFPYQNIRYAEAIARSNTEFYYPALKATQDGEQSYSEWW